MADAINTGTMLIDEGTLMPESLRFESEPWTFFYMAGEIIRESRMAPGKQSRYGSEGNVAHSDKLIDHYNDLGNLGDSPIASSSLAPEWVEGRASRKRWPSRTRISSTCSAFRRATLHDATRHSRIGGRLHLVGSTIF